MNQQELQEKFSEELLKFEQETMFPAEQLPAQFNDWKREAMRFYAPSALKMVPANFEKLYKLTEYNIEDMGTLINIMERATMKNLDMVFEDYIFYQMTLERMAATWKELVEPEQQRLQRKYQAMAKIARPEPKGKTMPLGQA